MAKHVVKQGDCIGSIAFEKGFFWETILNLPENAELKRERKDPNVLLAGDQVFIPDKREKTDVCATEQRHRFRRKGTPENLQVRVLYENVPRANEPYVLEIDGQAERGTTDADGNIRRAIPPNARRGKLTVGEGAEQLEFDLTLGAIDPIDTLTGVQERLNNLGYDCGEEDGMLGEETERALRDFQADHDLEETGQPDEPTRQELRSQYRC